MRKAVRIFSIALIFYGTHASAAEMKEAAMQDVDDSKANPQSAIDDDLAKRFGTAHIQKMIELKSEKPETDIGAHVTPIIRMKVGGVNGEEIRVGTAANDFRNKIRLQIGGALSLQELSSIWKSTLSKEGRMGIERPLPNILEQPLDAKGIIGAKFMVKDTQQKMSAGKSFIHGMLVYQFPYALTLETLLDDRLFAQYVLGLTHGPGNFLLKINLNNLSDKENTKIWYDPENLKMRNHCLDQNQKNEGLAIVKELEIMAPNFNFTQAYNNFLADLKEALSGNMTGEAVQQFHKRFTDSFGKFGLHANKEPTEAQVDAHLRLNYDRESALYLKGLPKQKRLEELGWREKIESADGTLFRVNAIEQGIGAISFPPIVAFDLLFKSMYRLEQEEKRKGNKAHKPHEHSSALLPVLIKTPNKGFQVAHLAIFDSNLKDLYSEWKENAEFRLAFKPQTRLEKKYYDELVQALKKYQKIEDTMPLDTPFFTPIELVHDGLRTLAKVVQGERISQAAAGISEEQWLADQAAQNRREAIWFDDQVPSESQFLSRAIETKVIDTDSPLAQSFEMLMTDMVSLEINGDMSLASEGQNFSPQTVKDIAKREDGSFQNPATRTWITPASLIPNTIMSGLVRKVATMTEPYVLRNMQVSDEALAAMIRAGLEEHSKNWLEFFDEDLRSSEAITMTLDFPEQGLIQGNTYPISYAAKLFFPKMSVPEAIIALKGQVGQNFYPNLQLQNFMREQKALLLQQEQLPQVPPSVPMEVDGGLLDAIRGFQS